MASLDQEKQTKIGLRPNLAGIEYYSRSLQGQLSYTNHPHRPLFAFIFLVILVIILRVIGHHNAVEIRYLQMIVSAQVRYSS
ncbi:hypothetical protein TMatcc_004775 [Talaromyces marneffei ATCC 18224]